MLRRAVKGAAGGGEGAWRKREPKGEGETEEEKRESFQRLDQPGVILQSEEACSDF